MQDSPLDMLQIKIDKAREELPKETRKAIDSVDWRAIILSFREKKGYSFEQLEDLELETELLLCGLLNPINYPKEIEERLKLPKPQVDLLVEEMNELVFKKIKDELIKNSQREEIFIRKDPTDNLSNVVAVNEHISSPNIINTREPINNISNKGNPIVPIKPVEQIKDTPVLSKNTNIELMPEELTGNVIKTIPEIKKTPVKTPDVIIKQEEKPAESISSQKLSGLFQMQTSTTEYSLNNMSKQGDVQGASSDTKIKTSKVDPYRLDPNAD